MLLMHNITAKQTCNQKNELLCRMKA